MLMSVVVETKVKDGPMIFCLAATLCQKTFYLQTKNLCSRFVVVMDVSGSMDANNNPEHIPRFDFEFREDEMDLKGLACLVRMKKSPGTETW